MLRSKLLGILRSFNADELKRFDAFIQSPYYNKSGKVHGFYKSIVKYAPSFSSEKLEKQKIYQTLYRGRVYNDSTMRELMSETFKLAKTFLAIEELNKDPIEQSILKFNWLMNRQSDKLAREEVELREELIAANQLDENYFYYKWMQSLHRLELAAVEHRGEEYKLLGNFDMLANIHALNINFIYRSFKSHLYLLSLSSIYKLKPDEDLLAHLEVMAAMYVGKGYAVIDLLFSIYQLLRKRNDECFFALKQSLFESGHSIPEILKVEAGVALENYCSQKLREGEAHFVQELFDVYRFVIDNKLYFESGSVSYVFYCNVAARGSELGELEWTNKFVEENKIHLLPEHREDTYNYSKAHLLFAEKKYKEALRTALLCNLPLFVIKILIRNLIARCQYELDMMEELQNELNAMHHHVSDDKLTEDRRRHLQLFITAMRLLSTLKTAPDDAKKKKLVRLIENEKGFANRRWFLQKIKELEIRRRN